MATKKAATQQEPEVTLAQFTHAHLQFIVHSYRMSLYIADRTEAAPVGFSDFVQTFLQENQAVNIDQMNVLFDLFNKTYPGVLA